MMEEYTPLPGFDWNTFPPGGENTEFENFFCLKPGYCINCGAKITYKEYLYDVFCSGRCRSNFDRTGGYIEPHVSNYVRCQNCGIRMMPGLDHRGCRKVRTKRLRAMEKGGKTTRESN